MTNETQSIKMVEWLETWFFKKINIISSFSNPLTETKVPSEKLVKDSLDTKVDKVNGKGLSTNDYDNVSKAKVDNLKDVAFSGSYNDLTDKPTFDNVDDELNANSNNPVSNSVVTSALANKANTNHTHNEYLINHQDISGKENISNKVISWSDTVTDEHYPSEKLVKSDIDSLINSINNVGNVFNNLATVAWSGNYNNLINQPTIPSGSNVTPNSDATNGVIGSSSNYARADHVHPISSLYAESTHTHTKNQITDFPTLSNVAFSGSYDDLTNKPEISSSGEIVNIGFGFDRDTKEIYLEFNNE